MSKTGTVLRYDVYKRPRTQRIPPVFVMSIEANEAGNIELFRVATKAFEFDRSNMLQYIQNHNIEKPNALSTKGLIVKVFADCSPAQRIKVEKQRVDGIYGKSLTKEQLRAKEYYQAVLDNLINLTSSLVK